MNTEVVGLAIIQWRGVDVALTCCVRDYKSSSARFEDEGSVHQADDEGREDDGKYLGYGSHLRKEVSHPLNPKTPGAGK